jgi:GTPase SAR1 family protein
MRYCEHKFKDNYVATIGIDFLRKSTEDFKISVWDMAGREI